MYLILFSALDSTENHFHFNLILCITLSVHFITIRNTPCPLARNSRYKFCLSWAFQQRQQQRQQQQRQRLVLGWEEEGGSQQPLST